jgi:hypothetical protein
MMKSPAFGWNRAWANIEIRLAQHSRKLWMTIMITRLSWTKAVQMSWLFIGVSLKSVRANRFVVSLAGREVSP